MTTTGAEAAPSVSLTEIANIVGVKPSAVSNWRARHKDFPSPIDRSARGDLFSLDQVLDWLRARKYPLQGQTALESQLRLSTDSARGLNPTDTLTASLWFLGCVPFLRRVAEWDTLTDEEVASDIEQALYEAPFSGPTPDVSAMAREHARPLLGLPRPGTHRAAAGTGPPGS